MNEYDIDHLTAAHLRAFALHGAEGLTRAAELGAEIAAAAERDPDGPIVLAARLALDVADERRAERNAMRNASHAVAAGLAEGWADRHMPFEVLQQRRTELGPFARAEA